MEVPSPLERRRLPLGLDCHGKLLDRKIRNEDIRGLEDTHALISNRCPSLFSSGLPIGGSGEGDQGAHRCSLPEELDKGRTVHMRAKWPARHLFLFFAITTQRLGT